MANKYDDPRWQRKRLQVFARDGWSCVCCSDGQSPLHAHHKTYGEYGKPWVCDLNDLQTLCATCHSELGPHPRGGLWWSHHEDESVGILHVAHCPVCGSKSFSDFSRKDFRYSCLCCEHRLPFGDRGWLAFRSTPAAVPLSFGKGVSIGVAR